MDGFPSSPCAGLGGPVAVPGYLACNHWAGPLFAFCPHRELSMSLYCKANTLIRKYFSCTDATHAHIF